MPAQLLHLLPPHPRQDDLELKKVPCWLSGWSLQLDLQHHELQPHVGGKVYLKNRTKRPPSPALCLRRESGPVSSYEETTHEFLLPRLHMSAPPTDTHKTCNSMGVVAALTCPLQTHLRQTPLPPLGPKPAVSSVKCTWEPSCSWPPLTITWSA